MSETLPAGWKTATLGELTVSKVELGPPKHAVPYIDIGAIDRETKRIVGTTPVTTADAPTRARQWVRKGDVLVSMTRPNLNAVALVGIEHDGAVASTGFDVLRPTNVLPEWLFYRVRSNEFISDVCGNLQGVVYPAIRPQDVRRHRLPVPPADEQRTVVAAIDSYFTRLDDAVATLAGVQKNLKRYRASVLKAAVEGRLVPTEAALARAERRDYEPASTLLARILVERRQRWEAAKITKLKASGKPPKVHNWKAKYKEPVQPDTDGLPKLPEGWCWATVEQLITEPLSNGRSVKTAAIGFPVLRLSALADGIIDVRENKIGAWTAKEAFPYRIAERDFLVSRGNGSIRLVGVGGVVQAVPEPVAFPDTMIRFRVSDGVDLQLFRHIWNSRTVRNQIERKAKTTAGIYKVNQGDLETCVIPLPPVAEQVRIRERIERLVSEAEAADAEVQRAASRSVRFRQAILKWAFEGKLVAN